MLLLLVTKKNHWCCVVSWSLNYLNHSFTQWMTFAHQEQSLALVLGVIRCKRWRCLYRFLRFAPSMHFFLISTALLLLKTGSILSLESPRVLADSEVIFPVSEHWESRAILKPSQIIRTFCMFFWGSRFYLRTASTELDPGICKVPPFITYS